MILFLSYKSNMNFHVIHRDMEIVTTDGVIGIVITDENGQVLFDKDMITTSSFSIEVPGKINVRINCDDHKGSY